MDSKVLIGVPCGKQPVCNDFTNAYERLIVPPNSIKQQAIGGSVPLNLNRLVDCAIETKCSHLFIVEDDSTFEPDALMRLLKWDVPVVAGLCRERHFPFQPFVYEWVGDGFRTAKLNNQESGLIQCDATGMGGILINLDVFSKLTRPYFHHYFVGEKEWGQDLVFAKSLIEAKIPIHYDPSVIIGHITQCTVSTEGGCPALIFGHAKIELKSLCQKEF